jgi:hypothetical protein
MRFFSCLLLVLLTALRSVAQGDAVATAKLDGAEITVGDQSRLFIEVRHSAQASKITWAAIPDSINHLEVLEKGKIDTVTQGDVVTYKQRLLVTGFDSGLYQLPALVFTVTPAGGGPYTVQTDSFRILVNTVAVDTTKPFKGIKDIIYVKATWRDYIWYIAGGFGLVLIAVLITIYLLRRKKPAPVVPEGPKETVQEKTLRVLGELEAKQLWQQGKVKEYYTELTDIVRTYIEERFNTPAMELTTDQLLYKAAMHRELQPYQVLLGNILTTADLAKFAKAQPLPQEHTASIEAARQFVVNSKPVVVVTETENNNNNPAK